MGRFSDEKTSLIALVDFARLAPQLTLSGLSGINVLRDIDFLTQPQQYNRLGGLIIAVLAE
jgi:hypothetical protein